MGSASSTDAPKWNKEVDLKRIVISMLKLYQWILSPLVGPCCRFYPTCSNYMIEAVETHGLCRGAWLGVKRLLKCHPFYPGGVDSVPEIAQTRIDAK
jgi:uncharacterized protein